MFRNTRVNGLLPRLQRTLYQFKPYSTEEVALSFLSAVSGSSSLALSFLSAIGGGAVVSLSTFFYNEHKSAETRKRLSSGLINSSQNGTKDFKEMYNMLKTLDVDAADQFGFTALHYAVQRDNPQLVEILLLCGAKLGSDNDNESVLLKAVLSGHDHYVDTILNLIAHDKLIEQVNQQSKRGMSPLFGSLYTRNFKLFKKLLLYGGKIDMEGPGKATLLHCALRTQQPEIARYLINNIVDKSSYLSTGKSSFERQPHPLILDKMTYKEWINAEDADKQTPLTLACFYDYYDIASSLIERGANINQIEGPFQRPLLGLVLLNGKEKVFDILINHPKLDLSLKSRPDRSLYDSITMVTNGKDQKLYESYFSMKDKLFRNLSESRLALKDAAFKAAKDAVHEASLQPITDYIQHGGKLTDTESESDNTTLFDHFVRSGKWDTFDDRGSSIFHLISRFNDPEMFDKLCTSMGKDKTRKMLLKRTNSGCTAMTDAASYGSLKLIHAYFAVTQHLEDETNGGWTPLSCAIWGGHVAAARDILSLFQKQTRNSHSKDPCEYRKKMYGFVNHRTNKSSTATIENHYNKTPLMWILNDFHDVPMELHKEFEDLIMHMLENEADINLASGNGETPLHIMAAKGLSNVATRVLEKYGDDILLEAATYDLQERPLHFAAEKDQKKMVELLLDAGADHTATNSGGRRPCELAPPKSETKRVFERPDLIPAYGPPMRRLPIVSMGPGIAQFTMNFY
jgi:ankyrin repeat protein